MNPLHDLSTYTEHLEKWLAGSPATLRAATAAEPSFAARVEAMSALMRSLFDEGWGRYGWPEELGGLGGTILHRAALWEASHATAFAEWPCSSTSRSCCRRLSAWLRARS